MSAPIIVKYPLDLTGSNPNNLVITEPHVIGTAKVRAIVPNHGPFYTQDLIIRDNRDGSVLQPDLQYAAMHLYGEAVQRTGLEVCAAIVITDESVSANITIDYQVVGGEFSSSTYAIRTLLEALEIDEREVVWGKNIIGLPTEFPPTHHLHDAGDLYGFEFVVEALEKIHNAIILGDQASRDEIYRYIDVVEARLTSNTDDLSSRLDQHIADKLNPHETTKSQVGLGDVENYPLASELEAQTGGSNERYMTPLTVKVAIEEHAGKLLDQHVSDKSNPHEVTVTQLGLENVPNFPVASMVEAQAGLASDRLMTPQRDKQAFDKWLADAFRNGFTFPRDSHYFSLKFQHGPDSTDPGGITHTTTGTDASVLRLHVSDNPVGNNDDLIELGAGWPGGSQDFQHWMRINHTTALFSGTVNAQDYYLRSDSRAKDYITPIPNALAKVMQLSGNTYLQKHTQKMSAGVIAQELQKVLPESVSLSDPENSESELNVQLAGPVALLVEGMKEQQGIIDQLSARILQLEQGGR